ncbi:MAG: hypothetical protein HUU20_12060 [Pirellulales bacterium]|nr:hypothetical protein [Pirellulales bacterium]
MNRLSASFFLSCFVGLATVAAASPPTCTVHFFDWYVVDENSPLEARRKQWTYEVRWDLLGIQPAEIGNTEHYYEVQFAKIREAGFDGIHYEWHRNNPKPQFLAAAEKTGVPLAMFYDMEIRFSGRPNFITPTPRFAEEAIGDVLSFYRSVPRKLWLKDRNGKLPIIVYGYAFDRNITDPARWDEFYRSLVRGIEEGLGERIVLHWTDASAPQQVYAYQRFPEIQSYTFNEASRQTQIGARSVTFVVHYDDLGVSFARSGPRGQRWIRNDIRYLQESLWLAKHTDPDLVFNYGWNELYEGEHLLPDSHWEMWRYDLASAMVRDIKAHTRADLPRVLVIADDLLPALHKADPVATAVFHREMELLNRLRSIVPQANTVVTGRLPDLSGYQVIFALNRVKTAEEEGALLRSGKTVVYAGPEAQVETPITRRFTSAARGPLPPSRLGPANEYVVAGRPVDVDLGKFPRLEARCRNSPGTVLHIRYEGLNEKGERVQAWYESSPTDDRQTGGQWQTVQADVSEIARHAVGGPVSRLTRIDLILDDLDENGRFTLDVDRLRMLNAAGETGWEEPFDDVNGWTVHASFEGVAGGESRFELTPAKEDAATLGRLVLIAAVEEGLGGPADESTQWIEPLPDVRVLWHAPVREQKVPLLLARDRCYWLNTYSPTDEGWEKIIPEVLKLPVHRGVLFGSFSHAVTASGLTSRRDESVMVVGEEELPIDRVRLVAPPELDQSLPQTLPASRRPMSLRVIQGQRKEVPLPDPGSSPPSVTLRPGEVVEVAKSGK